MQDEKLHGLLAVQAAQAQAGGQTTRSVQPEDTPSLNPNLRYPDLKPLGVPYSRSHLKTLEDRDEFPKRFRLSANVICWDRNEVLDWLAERRGGQR